MIQVHDERQQKREASQRIAVELTQLKQEDSTSPPRRDERQTQQQNRPPLTDTLPQTLKTPNDTSIRLRRISRDEFDQVPRATRGRISVPLLNDALKDIESLCRRRRRFVIAEQEFRNKCSFFRNGESTARSILLILRSLGRLQQVPVKTGDATYTVVTT